MACWLLRSLLFSGFPFPSEQSDLKGNSQHQTVPVALLHTGSHWIQTVTGANSTRSSLYWELNGRANSRVGSLLYLIFLEEKRGVWGICFFLLLAPNRSALRSWDLTGCGCEKESLKRSVTLGCWETVDSPLFLKLNWLGSHVFWQHQKLQGSCVNYLVTRPTVVYKVGLRIWAQDLQKVFGIQP